MCDNSIKVYISKTIKHKKIPQNATNLHQAQQEYLRIPSQDSAFMRLLFAKKYGNRFLRVRAHMIQLSIKEAERKRERVCEYF